jgi:hypothetical protein
VCCVRVLQVRPAPRVLHLQTANASALSRFTTSAVAVGLGVAFTHNARPEDDAWGGSNAALVMEQTIVAAVNAHVATHARFLISPSSSAWTPFLGYLMDAEHQTSLCCGCRRSRGLVRLLAARDASAAEFERAIARSTKCKRLVARKPSSRGENRSL